MKVWNRPVIGQGIPGYRAMNCCMVRMAKYFPRQGSSFALLLLADRGVQGLVVSFVVVMCVVYPFVVRRTGEVRC